MNEFWVNILGTFSPLWYAAAFVFALFGLFIRWYIRTRIGIRTNPDSPDKFSWSYWWANNGSKKIASVFATAIIIFLCLRFASDWFGIAPSMAFAVGIGLAFDWFLDFVKRMTQKKNAAK